MSLPHLTVNLERLTGELETLASFSDAPAPAVTRVLYTEADMEGRAYVKSLIQGAGLELREDGLGTIFARWPGLEPGLPAVATGSHTDAIPYSGRYDGTVGVLGGLEAIRSLQATGVRPRRSIELIVFTAEEPTRFGLGCLGSRAMGGALTPEAMRDLRDPNGVSLEAARTGAGFTAPLEGVRLHGNEYSAFVELHIEQGPRLEVAGVPVGIVTAIAAPASLRLTLEGEGGHAGAVLMAGRHDALLAASEVALAVERAALSSGSPDTVGTVGVLKVHPGAVNSIPSRVDLTVDLRDIHLERRDKAKGEIEAAVHEIAARRGVTATLETLNADPPATCDPAVVGALEGACAALGLNALPLVSRAYHDALFMARVAPVGMVFIPCLHGVSHRPDEYAAPEDIRRGVEVLAHALAQLADAPA